MNVPWALEYNNLVRTSNYFSQSVNHILINIYLLSIFLATQLLGQFWSGNWCLLSFNVLNNKIRCHHPPHKVSRKLPARIHSVWHNLLLPISSFLIKKKIKKWFSWFKYCSGVQQSNSVIHTSVSIHIFPSILFHCRLL